MGVPQTFHGLNESDIILSKVVFFLSTYIMACWTYGLSVPRWITDESVRWTSAQIQVHNLDCVLVINIFSGLFVPLIMVGATFGRLFGSLLLLAGLNVYVGTYSLIGAAALLGGVVRMTGIVQLHSKKYYFKSKQNIGSPIIRHNVVLYTVLRLGHGFGHGFGQCPSNSVQHYSGGTS